ncbi:hypothetical protein BD410DRAFT_782971 [Rickenella mellea]|uniref:Histone-lysine N-methyltransferase, H3 lysine-36 specific n=1 Tax=Rickenella mellea TaxID=50990 RepID=A0A4Y7QIE9_9AGAM|nr:hypothetical protein BD410DRAFT_782971 [Rickenella mellea]
MTGSSTPKAEETTSFSDEGEDEKSLKSTPSTPRVPEPTPSPSKRTPPETSSGNGKAGPQLIDHLPCAREQAMKTFEELHGNNYQYSTLGRSREALESMTCDCQYEHDEDDPSIACGDGSDCINRLTQVECLEDDCRCRSYCQNQRFQRRQYANIGVVLTEKKGFGLRASSDIRKDAFIYEYIGDVVSQPSFAKRMRDYAAEGIRHFYFMMLQKDEFIDATKRGGIGRFANHSCSPNCYVAKWTVGKYVRMGIFAKRSIQKDEELTFNYNVDRYGHEAQPCYCGEPNCVGFIGGKTQTDVAAMDDLYLDALGITDEVEMYGLKGNKRKKGKKLDEDYMPILRPLLEKDVPKVVQAVRQTQSRKVMSKLLTRVKMTEDGSALRQLMRLRGFSLMCNILRDFAEDVDMRILVLECISTWPLLQRNKVEDSQIEEPVKDCLTSSDEKLRGLAEKLLAQWAILEVGYRIPKRSKTDANDDNDGALEAVSTELEDGPRPAKRNRMVDLDDDVASHLQHLKPLGMSGGSRSVSQSTQATDEPNKSERLKKDREQIARVIAEASKAAAEAQAEAAAAAAAAALQAKAEEQKKISSANGKSKQRLSKEEKEALKEKKLMKLVGAVVVKCMSKHQHEMGHDLFKKHAKELTQVISEKEKKSQSYQSGKLDALSEEKVTKIKKFAKEYIAKVLRKLDKSGRVRPPASAGSTSNLSATPTSVIANGEDSVEMSLENTLDLEDDDDDTEDPSPATDVHGTEPDVSVMEVDDPDCQMIIPSKAATRSAGKEPGWDPDGPLTSGRDGIWFGS